jgi:hypothetical protein
MDLSRSYSYEISQNDADSTTKYSDTKTLHIRKTGRNAFKIP